MILVYTGNGKGKTSACVGQAIRALGHNMQVFFAQFMKCRDHDAGEQRLLSELLGERLYIGGLGFFRDEEKRGEHRQAALNTLNWCRQYLESADFLILDESLNALRTGLLKQEELVSFISRARAARTHLTLSGRGLPDWLKEQADLISEIQEIKHPFTEGAQPEKGIEY